MDSVWNTLHEQGWGKYPNESVVRFLSRYKKSKGDKFKGANRLIDIGCGAGANGRMCIELGFNVTGIDGAKAAIENAKKWAPQATYKVMDFDDLGGTFNDETFDIAIDDFAMILGTKDQFNNRLRQMSAILKRGGSFIAIIPSNKTPKEVVPSEASFLTKAAARKVYGKYFNVMSVDSSSYTEFNGKKKVDLMVIIGQRR
jgi:SAM-dependent methyltransferase